MISKRSRQHRQLRFRRRPTPAPLLILNLPSGRFGDHLAVGRDYRRRQLAWAEIGLDMAHAVHQARRAGRGPTRRRQQHGAQLKFLRHYRDWLFEIGVVGHDRDCVISFQEGVPDQVNAEIYVGALLFRFPDICYLR